GHVADTVRLRRDDVGAGVVAGGGVRDLAAAGGRVPARPRHRRPLAGGRRAAVRGGGALLGPRPPTRESPPPRGAAAGAAGARGLLIVGLSMLFAPLNVAAYASIPKELRGAAVGLFSLLRNEGGSVGTSLAQTVQERRLQHHTLRLNEWLDPLNQNLADYWETARAGAFQQTGDPAGAPQ